MLKFTVPVTLKIAPFLSIYPRYTNTKPMGFFENVKLPGIPWVMEMPCFKCS